MGGITSLFALLGGAWGPIASSGALTASLGVPAVVLAGAGRAVALDGGMWPARGWLVVALWTVAMVRQARREPGTVTPSGPEPTQDMTDDLDDVDDLDDFELRRARWASGWRRIVFPGVFLFYLGQTGHAVGVHHDGVAALAGYVILAAFATCYVRALPSVIGGVRGRFWWGTGRWSCSWWPSCRSPTRTRS